MPWRPLPDERNDLPEPLGRPLDRLLQNLGAARARTVRSVFDDWAEVVGEPLAAHVTPVSLRRGRLVVTVGDSAWATQLRFLEPQLLSRLTEAFGPGEVRAIDVKVRPVSDRAHGPAHRPGAGPGGSGRGRGARPPREG